MGDTASYLHSFKAGDSEAVCQRLVGALLGQRIEDGDALYIHRAVTLIGAMASILVWMRDAHGRSIDAEAIRSSMQLSRLEDLAVPSSMGMPDEFQEPLLRYLEGLPGYEKPCERDRVRDHALHVQHRYVMFPYLERALDAVRAETEQDANSI